MACGYADGYPRHAQNGTPVAIDGIFLSLVGRVSMDMLYVDLTKYQVQILVQKLNYGGASFC